MTSNKIYIVAFGVGLKCPRKIHLNTQRGGGGSRGVKILIYSILNSLEKIGIDENINLFNIEFIGKNRNRRKSNLLP
jgi:hypothetical protein